MGRSVLYNLVFLLHLTAVVVGFGTSFALPALSARARGMKPAERAAVNRALFAVSDQLTNYPIVAAGVLGLILVLLSDGVFKFSQAWVGIAFLFFFAIVGIIFLLQRPNAKAMDALAERLASAPAGGGKGGPPAEMTELEERGKKSAMFDGIVHLLWLLLMIDMVFKPFL